MFYSAGYFILLGSISSIENIFEFLITLCVLSDSVVSDSL